MTVLIIAVGVFLFMFLWMLYACCVVAGRCSRAEERRELLRRMEEASAPRIVNGDDV
jgi:hypothetical protein